jgi:hypothetical protein
MLTYKERYFAKALGISWDHVLSGETSINSSFYCTSNTPHSLQRRIVSALLSVDSNEPYILTPYATYASLMIYRLLLIRHYGELSDSDFLLFKQGWVEIAHSQVYHHPQYVEHENIFRDHNLSQAAYNRHYYSLVENEVYNETVVPPAILETVFFRMLGVLNNNPAPIDTLTEIAQTDPSLNILRGVNISGTYPNLFSAVTASGLESTDQDTDLVIEDDEINLNLQTSSTNTIQDRESSRALALRYSLCFAKYNNEWAFIRKIFASDDDRDQETAIEYTLIKQHNSQIVRFNPNEWEFPIPRYGFLKYGNMLYYARYQKYDYTSGLSYNNTRITALSRDRRVDRDVFFNLQFLDLLLAERKIPLCSAVFNRYKYNVLTPELLLIKSTDKFKLMYHNVLIGEVTKDTNDHTANITLYDKYQRYRPLLLSGVVYAK